MSEHKSFDDSAAVQGVLEERARRLARPLQGDGGADTLELVVLTLGRERYGVDARRALEVHPLTAIAPVPGTPAFWAGVVNVRGTLYPVLDLRQYLGLPEVEARERVQNVVLVSGPGLIIGLLVDHAPGVLRVVASTIAPPIGGMSESVRRVVQGVTEDTLAILDVDALLSDSVFTAMSGAVNE